MTHRVPETTEKKIFLLRQTLEYVLNSDISNEAKIFYVRIFAGNLPEEVEGTPVFTLPRIRIDCGVDKTARCVTIATLIDEQVVNELLEKQFIISAKQTGAKWQTDWLWASGDVSLSGSNVKEDEPDIFAIVPRIDFGSSIDFPDKSQMPDVYRSCDGMSANLRHIKNQQDEPNGPVCEDCGCNPCKRNTTCRIRSRWDRLNTGTDHVQPDCGCDLCKSGDTCRKRSNWD